MSRPSPRSPTSSDVFPLPLEALRIPRIGRAYDLSSGWWPGMPIATGHPPFQLLTYRSPAGQRNQHDLAIMNDNRINFGFVSELILCTSHSGTHIDALGHVTCGPHASWYGGYSSETHLGDFGLLKSDATELGPLIGRGIMLDIPAALGLSHLAPHQAVNPQELKAACDAQGVDPREGDTVLIRTGAMCGWPDEEALAACDGSGLSIEGAQWLHGKGVAAVGGDNSGLEVSPTTIPGDPLPVHRFLIQERGVPILEWVNVESLARDKVHEFLFICLPLTMRGATGSMVRPLAVV